MSYQSDTLALLKSMVGDDNYQTLVSNAGGEYQLFEGLVQHNGGEYEAYEAIRKIAQTPSTPSSSSSSTAQDLEPIDSIVLWITIGVILLSIIALAIDGYSKSGWGGAISGVLVGGFYGYQLFWVVFWFIRKIHWVAGIVVIGGGILLLLYILFKVGFFVVESGVSFFDWLF